MNSKIALLLQQNRQIFHTQDLAVIWNITNLNTLYTTIKRYIRGGILYPIQKGMYATISPQKLDPLALGLAAMHRYAYISCETVLQQEGYINQVVAEITIVSSQTRHFTLAEHRYHSRQLKDEWLYTTIGIIQQDGLFVATPMRALADLLYFNPYVHIDKQPDWHAVREMQTSIGYPQTQRL